MSIESTTVARIPRYRIRQMDAVDLLRSLPAESLDLVVLDIAYESLEKHRKIGTTTRLKKKWFKIFKNERIPELMSEVYRTLKRNRHFYFFCDAETMFAAKPMGEGAGFKFWKPIIWDKMSIGMGYHYRAQCERILFFEKGKRKLNNLGVSDVLKVKAIRGKDAYPTEKPPELLSILIENSTQPDELVCDVFMGGGAAGVAALELGRDFLGGDISSEAMSLTNGRLAERGTESDLPTWRLLP